MELDRLTLRYPALTVAEGYEIQHELIKIKLSRSCRIIGMKMGLTSEAKIKQIGIHQPICGYLFDYMRLPNGRRLDTVSFHAWQQAAAAADQA